MPKKINQNNQMANETSSPAGSLPRKGALRKKRKVEYFADSTDDETVNEKIVKTSYNTKEENVDTISISSTSDVEEPRKQMFPKKFIESGIRNTTNLKRISAAHQPPNQKQITQFFRSTKTSSPAASYFETHQQSKLSNADIKSAEVKPIKNVMGRKNRPHQSKNDNRLNDEMQINIPEALINDDSGFGVSENDVADNSVSVAYRLGKCPRYKVVEGTTFAVDAFRYGDIEGVSKYFLTHYHSDHFIGLKRTFNKPLYASTITAKLVRTFIGVDALYITEMLIDTEYSVENIKVIALDANHCPGAVMFLFKFPSGQCTLHTGDFRASADMESYPQFWNCNIDTVYLDTTYMKQKANFKLQMHSIEEVKNQVQRFLKKNILNKHLIVVGTYTIGKEKVWMSIANTFKIKVWLEETRRKAAIAIYGEQSRALRWVVANKEEAGMHVIPLNKINYQFLVEYHKDYSDRALLGIRPSGWEKSNASNATFNSRISLIGVQYSEHSSYEELDRFMRFLRPNKIIPTVESSQSADKMPKIPNSFYYSNKPNEPKQFGFQISLSNFIRPMSNKTVDREEASNPLSSVIEVPSEYDQNEAESLADYMS